MIQIRVGKQKKKEKKKIYTENKIGRYVQFLIEREDFLELVASWLLSIEDERMQGHLSKENNYEELAYEAVCLEVTINDIIFHTWKNDLCLRISKTGIVLKNLWSFPCQHQSEENNSGKWSSLRS